MRVYDIEAEATPRLHHTFGDATAGPVFSVSFSADSKLLTRKLAGSEGAGQRRREPIGAEPPGILRRRQGSRLPGGFLRGPAADSQVVANDVENKSALCLRATFGGTMGRIS